MKSTIGSRLFFTLFVFLFISCNKSANNVTDDSSLSQLYIFVEQYDESSISKIIHTGNYLSWSTASEAFHRGDYVAWQVIKIVGQNAIDDAGIDWHFTDDDVNYMLFTDFAQEFGLYEEQDEENKSEIRSYKIRTYKDAKDATRNKNFVYFADRQGNVYVSKKIDDKHYEHLYKLHGNAEYYGFERGTTVRCDTYYHDKAREDFAAALYAMVRALKSVDIQKLGVISDAFYPLNNELPNSDLNFLKSLIDPSHFYVIYPTVDGYSRCVSSFPNGRKLNGINVNAILSVAIGTRLSEFVLECENSEGLRFLVALKSDIQKYEREKICRQLSEKLQKVYEGTPVSVLLSPDFGRVSTYIHNQPIQESNGKKYQALQLSYNNVIRSGFDNIPLSMAGMIIFHIFDEDGNSYYDIRNNKDPNKGSSILGDLRIDNAYDFAQYMNLFNVLFNEVPERLDEEKSKTTCERWLFGVDEIEMGSLSDEDKKRVKAYGKKTKNTLQNIENNTSETVRDRIAARLLQGNTAFFPQGGGEEIKNGQYGEGMCYFTGDDYEILHILFRQDGGNGWAEFVVNTDTDTFHIQPTEKTWVKEKTTKLYKTMYYKK
ncbi:MAG: hypothetical protein J5642_08075 [Bacteroidales bacterium]|nr:hypothetical protein [Bacteroidales bacterium]